MVEWLNTAFYSFDYSILHFYHTLAQSAGGVLTPLMRAITFIGEKGLWMLLLAVVLLLFANTRRTGVALIGAVGCGWIITSALLKNIVARPRPYEDIASDFFLWWKDAGAVAEDSLASFPSGHMTAAVAGIVVLYLCMNAKVLYAGIPYVVLMGASRNYLMGHYPSDVVAGALVGLFSGALAYLIASAIWSGLKKVKDTPFGLFCLYFDIRMLWQKE